jgi:hypothetical protein
MSNGVTQSWAQNGYFVIYYLYSLLVKNDVLESTSNGVKSTGNDLVLYIQCPSTH